MKSDLTHLRSIWIEHQKTQNSNSSKGELWWPSLISYHVVSHVECQPLPEIAKMDVMALPLKIETCNENQTPLSVGESSNWTYCQPWQPFLLCLVMLPPKMADNMFKFSNVWFNLTSCGLNLTSHESHLISRRHQWVTKEKFFILWYLFYYQQLFIASFEFYMCVWRSYI